MSGGVSSSLPSIQQAQCKNIQQAAYVLDFSAGTAAHLSLYQNLMAFFKLVEPFVIDMHVTTPEEFDMLYHRMLDEMALDTFRAISFVLSVWGETQ